MWGKELTGQRRITLIHCFSGEWLSGVRCFVTRDVGAAAGQEPIGARRTFSCQALILPRDGSSRHGCESNCSGASARGSVGAGWACRAAVPGACPLGAPSAAPRSTFAAGGTAQGVPSPSRAAHAASKPRVAAFWHRAGHSNVPGAAGAGPARALLQQSGVSGAAGVRVSRRVRFPAWRARGRCGEPCGGGRQRVAR